MNTEIQMKKEKKEIKTDIHMKKKHEKQNEKTKVFFSGGKIELLQNRKKRTFPR